MVRREIKLKINHDVVKWARETSGYSASEVSKKLSINEEIINKWENEDCEISITVLRRLSKQYKRSFEVFLLSRAPQERSDPKYRLSEELQPADMQKLKLIIRDAKWVQDTAEELNEKLQMYEEKIHKYKISFAATEAAEIERKEFNVTINDQESWKDKKDALNEWIYAIESKGILIVQISMPRWVRGFSMPDRVPQLIALNALDAPTARIFTLFHEYAHILLDESGVCNPSNLNILETSDQRSIEVWCNNFAASFLMPEGELRSLINQHGINQRGISKLCYELKVSKEALLIRLYRLKIIEDNYFKQEVELAHRESLSYLEKEISKSKKRIEKMRSEGKSLKLNILSKAKREHSVNFIRLVLNSRKEGIITTKDAMDYLSVGAENLDKLGTLV